MCEHFEHNLAEAIRELACAVREASAKNETNATLHRLAEMESKILSQLGGVSFEDRLALEEVLNRSERTATALEQLSKSTKA